MELIINKIGEGIISMSMTDKYFVYIKDREGNSVGTISLESLNKQAQEFNSFFVKG